MTSHIGQSTAGTGWGEAYRAPVRVRTRRVVLRPTPEPVTPRPLAFGVRGTRRGEVAAWAALGLGWIALWAIFVAGIVAPAARLG